MTDKSNRLTFVPENHSYLYDGFPIPSVSSILETKYPFPEWLKNTIKLQEAMEYGKAVHTATEEHDLNIPHTWTPYDMSHALELWKRFKKNENASVYIHNNRPMVEEMMVNEDAWYCGTIDRIMEIDGKLWIVDIKSGWLSTRGSVQIAGYAIMARKNGIDIDNAMLVSLREDDYKIKITKPEHYESFLECLVMFYGDKRLCGAYI